MAPRQSRACAARQAGEVERERARRRVAGRTEFQLLASGLRRETDGVQAHVPDRAEARLALRVHDAPLDGGRGAQHDVADQDLALPVEVEVDLAARDRGGKGVGAGLDTIGQHRMIRAVQAAQCGAATRRGIQCRVSSSRQWGVPS